MVLKCKISIAAVSVVLAVSLSGADGCLWPEPTREARPWAYNWWMGSAVDEAGLRLQADEMKKVGMGGFHVIPIYSVRNNPNDRVLLSPAWMSAFGTAVRLARERGLGVDLTTGSGWCFGGPQLKPAEGCWKLQVGAEAPADAVVLWRGKKAGEDIVLFARPTNQQVKRSGPGGAGPMMNPLSSAAMTSFLKPFSAAFDVPGAPKPDHMYHDSYEYYGAGWSFELPAAFAKRRGYRLEDHYAELAGVGDDETVARVKCDYRETVSDLIVEDVFPRWTDWCLRRGIGTRNEAHGSPANWLDFYALADIPETEMFGCDKKRAQNADVRADLIRSGDRDILVSKFASSAAHVRHPGGERDPLVSSESCTWAAEHFCETLATLKTFVDRLFLAGVNHMFYHGSCYSPADAKWPGWTFYASTEMNRFNPIWRDADILNAYITRVQSVAQAQPIDNDILVYWPLHDFWTDAKGFEKQLTVHAVDWFSAQPVGRIARRLFDDGYAFDFISERGLMHLPGRSLVCHSYTTILVPGAKAMKPKTFRRLMDLAERGFTVLFVDGFPKTVPGFADVAAREAKLKKLVADATGGHAAASRIRAGSYEDLLSKAPVRREPFNKSNGLMFTRHAAKGETTYFIVNQLRDRGVKGRFKPASPCVCATVRDPLTGAGHAVEVVDGTVALDLPIGHSVLLTVGDGKVAAEAGRLPVGRQPYRTGEALSITSVWIRTAVAGGPAMPTTVAGTLPLPWGREGRFPETAFAGTMRYETKVVLDDAFVSSAPSFELSLGRVAHSAKVCVNGTYAGGAILPPYRVAIPSGLFKRGENLLTVEVTSTGANRLKWLDGAKPYAWKVFEDINMVDIAYHALDASTWKNQEYGLYGPVTLLW